MTDDKQKFVTEEGVETTVDDLQRAIWYGQCGYWTDNWEILTRVGPGIPACPKCKTPGFICTASQWFEWAEKYEATNPGYVQFLNEHKEKCYRHYPAGLMTVWEMRDEPRT